MSLRALEYELIKGAKTMILLNISTSIVNYVVANHIEIFEKAFVDALEKNKEQIDLIIKAIEDYKNKYGERKDNAEVQEETNPSDEL